MEWHSKHCNQARSQAYL